MKTAITFIVILVLSAVIIPPILPKSYPTKPVIEQRKDIVSKEKELQKLIKKIECTIEKDSIQICHLKRKIQNE